MYEAFYGFKEKPFSMLPDPGFLFLSKKHQTALTLLEYGLLNHVGFCIISGEPGAGKTTILRALLDRVGDDVTVGLITNTHQSFGGLLDWVLSAFNLHQPELTHVEMHQVFMEFLIEEYAKGRTTLLIVDEAQNMKPDALEELRMLSNVNTEKDQLMQVVLAGQPALKETLRLPDLMQFAQRIAVDYHLDPLNLEETCGYIQHRLVTAGSKTDVFTPAACARIHTYSGGTPRLINLLCETVLVYGFADQQEMIDVELVDEMVQERMKDSVVPIVNRDAAEQDNTEVNKALEGKFPWIKHRAASDTGEGVSDTGATGQTASSGVVQQDEEENVKPDIVLAEQVENAEKKTLSNSETDRPAEVTHEKSQPSASAESQKHQATELPASSSTSARHEDTRHTKKDTPGYATRNDENETRTQLVKYGVIAVILAIVLVALALTLDEDGQISNTEVVDSNAEEQARLLEQEDKERQQREQEEMRIRQLQIETETLKKERDAAIAKAEAERVANLEAAKQAAEAAALAAEAAAEKSRQEEIRRLEAAKQRERQAKQAEARAKEAAKKAELEAARLEEQKRVMEIRLEQEERLNKLEEVRRQELERLEKERMELQAAEELAAAEAAAKAAAEKKVKSAECTGPTARFRSGCR